LFNSIKMKRLLSILVLMVSLSAFAQFGNTIAFKAAAVPVRSGGGGGGGSNPFALVAHGTTNGATTTTLTLNTTGAKLIVAVLASDFDAANTFSDNKGNTWTKGTEYEAFDGTVQIAYCVNPTVGSGHTFTWANAAVILSVTAYSYSSGTPTHETETGTANGGSSFNSLQPGSQTPGGNGRLFVVGLGAYNAANPVPVAINQSFVTDGTFQNSNGGGPYISGSAFFLLQTTGSAVNPTVTPAATGSTGGVVMDSFY
jgi:hypothetical protein